MPAGLLVALLIVCLNAALSLEADPEWNQWPKQYGWWLSRRAKVLEALAQASGDA